MKLVTLDLGNSSLGIGIWDEDQLRSVHRLPHGKPIDPGLRGQMDRADVLAGCAVHGRDLDDFDNVRWVGSELRYPGTVLYEEPSELGLDRRVACYGALHRHGPSLVVDCGTCVTVTHIDANKRIRGLAITAGYGCLARGIGTAAPALDAFIEIGSEAPGSIPSGTRENLSLGVRIGWRGMIRELVTEACERLEACGESDFARLWTGTDAELARELIDCGQVSHGLVHVGLRQLVLEQ